MLLYDEVAPDASAMIESMRAHGYTLATAIADLIDNSIAARCRNVWLQFVWEAEGSWISITDDGKGMSEQELIDAMRLGSRSPLEERDVSDLGRFGLGLKTASFSQARRLTVITQPEIGRRSARLWDLDHLARPETKGWQLLRTMHPDTEPRGTALDDLGLDHGTQVLLEVIDRVTGPGTTSERVRDREDDFLWQIDRVRAHLAMVFHRFLTKSGNALRIIINDEQVEPWDPFLANHHATQPVGDYSQQFGEHGTPVKVTGFVLPHRDRFESIADHHAAGGPEGWNAQQGFYLYRNERLIISGDWLQLGWQKEEHFKLARIRLDIPNSMDHDWQIDVKKSTAAPPRALREWLRGIAQEVRRIAKDVYAYRGKRRSLKGKKADQSSPWIAVSRPGGEFSYRIDRNHPVLDPLIRSIPKSNRKEIKILLRLIEETVPVQRIWIDTAENQDGAALPFAGEKSETLKQLISLCHISKVRLDKVDPETAWDILADFDGFKSKEAQAIIAQLREGSA